MTPMLLDTIVAAAASTQVRWAASDGKTRGRALRAIAAKIEQQGEALVQQADAETHLGRSRLQGELARTAYQLRGFAEAAEDAIPFRCLVEQARHEPPPAGRPHLVRTRVPIGTVAVFAASNFPFAFSVLGGDTASALASGCPVVVRAHPAHPVLSRMLHAAALDAMVGADVDPAALGLVEGGGIEAGIALVEHPAVCAVAFTGSQTAGLALQECANARERPIPFYGELGSINPVVALPEAFDGSNEVDLAQMLAASITLGSGQFCTSPGVVIVFRGADGSKVFVDALCRALAEANTHEMLTTSMRAGFDAGVERLKAHAGVETLVGAAGSREAAPSSVLVRASAQEFIRQSSLREEVFGPAAVLIEVDTHAEAIAVLESIGGTLTTTVWGAHEDTLATRLVVRAAMRVSGRVLFRGVPTGVAVTEAQQHGGPFPSSTQPFATSVGFAAIDRFLRPIALQESPQWIAEALGRRPV